MLKSPFHRYNLFRNPFGELSREERAELAVVDLSQWQPYFQDDQSVLQFIGHCGSGKTTHLLAIQRFLPSRPKLLMNSPTPESRCNNAPVASRNDWSGKPLRFNVSPSLPSKYRYGDPESNE